MNNYEQRLQKLEDIFKFSGKNKMGTLSGICFNGLKTLFPNYEWEFRSDDDLFEIMFFCENKLVFKHIMASEFYKENIITFTENFILEKKLEIILS